MNNRSRLKMRAAFMVCMAKIAKETSPSRVFIYLGEYAALCFRCGFEKGVR